MKLKILTTALFIFFATSANANLIRNASFETVPNANNGQGIMPSDWISTNVTPDTYSNDGSYGLGPAANGNFTGATAFDGIRWVAAWSLAAERFAQVLTAPLVGGQTYDFSAYLLQAVRGDLDHVGGYALYLTSDASGDISSGALLGSIGPTTDSDDWEFASLTFVAPDDADSLPVLVFSPLENGSGGVYPGLDKISLTAVPVPAAVWLFGSALAGLGWLRRKQTI